MRQRVHQKPRNIRRTDLWGKLMYTLPAKDEEAMRKAALGGDRYAVNQDWRELIEEKSRFIPKIWGDIE